MSARPKPKPKKKPFVLFDALADTASNEATEIHSRLKSEDEIQEFSLADNLPELDRIGLLLDSKNEMQQSAGIANLTACVFSMGDAAFTSIFKRFVRMVTKGDDDIQQEAAIALAIILQIVADYEFIGLECMPFILKMVDSSSAMVPEWVDALLICITEHLPLPALQKIERMALDFSEVNQPKHSRLLACRILGVLPLHCLPNEEVVIVNCIKSLCQDTERDVRSIICTQLPAISCRCSAGPFDGKGSIFTELMELLQDEEMQIRAHALVALVEILPTISRTTVIDRVVPDVIKFYRDVSSVGPADPLPDLSTVPLETASAATRPQNFLRTEAVKQLGPMLVRLYKECANSTHATNNLSYCIEYYKSMAADRDPNIRRICAYNLPAIIQCLKSGQYINMIHSTVIALCSDPDINVRHTVAAGFHEIPVLVNNDRFVERLRPLFFKLLTDSDLSIQTVIVSNLKLSVPRLFKTFEERQRTVVDQSKEELMQPDEQIVSSLLEYDARLGRRWRERRDMYAQLDALCDFLCGDAILNSFQDKILTTMRGDAARPVQIAAANAIIHLMQRHSRWSTRIELCQFIVNDFAQSSYVRDRMLFLHMCGTLMSRFSRKWFIDRIIRIAVALCDDDVANVRSKAAQLLPAFRRVTKLQPYCESMEETIIKACERLVNDSDQDVRTRAIDADEEILRQTRLGASESSDEAANNKAKEIYEEAAFHDDFTSFSADFFRKPKSSSDIEVPLPIVPKPAPSNSKVTNAKTPQSRIPIQPSVALKDRPATKSMSHSSSKAGHKSGKAKSGAESKSIPPVPTVVSDPLRSSLSSKDDIFGITTNSPPSAVPTLPERLMSMREVISSAASPLPRSSPVGTPKGGGAFKKRVA